MTNARRAHPSSSDHANLFAYIIGFLLSIILTLGSFFLAPALGRAALPALACFALAQLLVQLVFFLHLGRDPKARSNLGLFSLTLVIIGVLIGGTLWIMHDLAPLHRHPSTPADLYEYGIVAPANELH
jgi:cytochrome o ubiquinol oxidase operon protein cyoD